MRGTKKAYSIEHENAVAKAYGGIRSPSSGASVTDGGDVRARSYDTLFEAKYAGSPGSELKRKPTLLKHFDKIADEAYEEGREPAVALRYYWPESPFASHKGWIDLTVRFQHEDVMRHRVD